MKRKLGIFSGVILALFLVTGIALPTEEFDGLQRRHLSPELARLFPVPKDNMNYFFLQSIENDTVIIIGDFTGVNKLIVYILDKGGDNTIDTVVDYYPENKKMFIRDKSESAFFSTDIAKIKRDIIYGNIYKSNYCDYMYSFNELETIVKKWDKGAIEGDVYGFKAQFREIDEKSKVAGCFSYGRKARGYYLQFRTIYYRTHFINEQHPLLSYSVYCKSTNDLVVKETVEALFKYRQPTAAKANFGQM